MKATISFLFFILISMNAFTQQVISSRHCSHRKQHTANPGIQPHRDTTGYDLHHMELALQLDPDTLYVAGTVTFRFTSLKDKLSSVVLDLRNNLQVSSVKAGDNPLDFTHKEHLLKVRLPEKLEAGKTGQFAVTYSGAPKSEGFGTFSQGMQNGKPIIWTLSEPFGARDWFPCKQWLRDKVDSLDVFVTHPAGYKAASNGMLVEETTSNGETTAHWRHRYPIATYLIAVAVTDYVSYSDYAPMPNGDSLQILNYVYRGEEDRLREKTAGVIPIMELFNELFTPYPFACEKYGHAQFGWGGGMEHQTMSFMGSFGHELMAHELAHQWFGNHITCGSWKEIWLNEGFAVYLTGLTLEHMFQGQYWNSWKKSVVNHVTSQKGGSVIVDDTTDVMRIFDYRLTYNKAGYVLHMLRRQIGDEAFFAAIKNYLRDKDLVNHYAHTADLRRHFEQAADTSLSAFFQDWIYSEGYPVYNLEWSQNEEGMLSVTVNQEASVPTAGFFAMHIQMRVSGNGQDTLLRFHHTQNKQTFKAKPGFQVQALNFNPELSILTKGAFISRVEEKSGQKNLQIVPNPSKDKIRLDYPDSLMPRAVRIFNTSGKLVYHRAVQQGKRALRVNVQNLEGGPYIVELKTRGYVLKKIFVKI